MTVLPHPRTIVPDRREPAGQEEHARLWAALKDAIDAYRAEPNQQTGDALARAYGAHQAALPPVPAHLRGGHGG